MTTADLQRTSYTVRPDNLIVIPVDGRVPEWFILFLEARRRAIMQELAEIEKILVASGRLQPKPK